MSTLSPRGEVRPASRVIVLTRGGRYGVLVLAALRQRGLIPAAVVVEAHAALHLCFRQRVRWRRALELPSATMRSLNRWLRPRLRRELRIGAPLVVTGEINSARMVSDLQRLRPDLLVIAGMNIVSASVLATPRLGAINAHLALLPWIRGNDVVAHSMLEGIALGTSCHLVDPGIDTGAVIGRRLLDVSKFEQTLAALEAASVEAGADMLADMVGEVIRSGGIPVATPQPERFPMHRFLDASRRAEADRLIRAGEARALYGAWSSLVTDGAGSLPAYVERPAVARKRAGPNRA